MIEYPNETKEKIFDHVIGGSSDVFAFSTYWLAKHLCCLYQRSFEIFDFSQKYGKQLQWIIIASVIAVVILFFNWQFFEGLPTSSILL